MNIKSAKFICSSSKSSQCPEDNIPEYAFIGRSNVGKSSLINMLTNNNSLAKVSSTPGKTRLINHFLINDSWYLVDLPGYGYARTSKSERSVFSKIISDYINNRSQLVHLFVLVDVRHEPQKIDVEFMNMLLEIGVQFSIIFTKADKLSANQCESSMARYRRILKQMWGKLPDMIKSSSEKKEGKDNILDYIDSLISEQTSDYTHIEQKEC